MMQKAWPDAQILKVMWAASEFNLWCKPFCDAMATIKKDQPKTVKELYIHIEI